MTEDTPDPGRFQRTLVRVLSVQVITLVLLFALQYVFRP